MRKPNPYRKLVNIYDEQTFVGHRGQIEQIGEDTEHSHLLFSVYDGLFNICSNCANAIRCVNDRQNKNWICFYEKWYYALILYAQMHGIRLNVSNTKEVRTVFAAIFAKIYLRNIMPRYLTTSWQATRIGR
jgi:hypothetical protein